MAIVQRLIKRLSDRRADMSTRKRRRKSTERVHVISRDEGWAIKKEGRSRASRILRTKDDAVRSTRTLQSQGHDIIIHRADGSIENWKKARK